MDSFHFATAANTVTIGVAIWGAITGTAALCLNAIKEMRDRPKIEVGLSYGIDLDGAYWEVQVANHGRRPVTVIEAGLRIALDFELVTKISGDSISNIFEPKIWEADANPYLLAPNEIHRHSNRVNQWPSILLTAEMPVRAYAIDSYGNGSTSRFHHVILDFLQLGWQPQGQPGPEAMKRDSPMQPKPLVARWKIWRPAYQRGPKQQNRPTMVISPAQPPDEQ